MANPLQALIDKIKSGKQGFDNYVKESEQGLDRLTANTLRRGGVADADKMAKDIRTLSSDAASMVGSLRPVASGFGAGPVAMEALQDVTTASGKTGSLDIGEQTGLFEYLKQRGSNIPASGEEFISQVGKNIEAPQISPDKLIEKRAIERSLESLEGPGLAGKSVADEYAQELKNAPSKLKMLRK